MQDSDPLFRKIDCLRLPVPQLEAALTFYRDALGHQLMWRTAVAAGLRLPDSDAELVVYTDGAEPETDLLVDDVPSACDRLTQAGSTVLKAPFDIAIGRCAVLRDPFGNVLVILDSSKGVLLTDGDGNVTGVG
jgi:catechol 2,3-dioxygenase-like lactoylglutathione lyase family enzyme